MKQLFFVPLLFFYSQLFAQYTVNGNASTNNCHCYTLTPNTFNQSGSVWNNIRINLSQSFDFNFDINLGCNTGNGADGIAFVLQPISTSVGGSGGGLGFEGITPSVGVTIDTWQNTEVNDPVFDHIAVQINGITNHGNTAGNIAGPVTALAGSDEIEDCQWHTLRVQWDAATNTFTAFVDGVQRLSITRDLVNTVFGGNPNVFWGFTGSTGGASNQQQFCTALSPRYNLLPDQKRCINEAITFYDTTISFTNVMKRYWDFGDGSNIDSVSLNPVHAYTAAGDYTVTQTVIGADGCSEINTQVLRVGGKPLADFIFTDSCVTNQVQFTDASVAPFGTINTWHWEFDNGTTSNSSSFTTQYANGGDKTIKLWIKTQEGCVSDTLVKSIHIYSRPVLDFTVTDSVCLGEPMSFTGIVVNSPDPVAAFAWNFGGNPIPTQNAVHTYQTAGDQTVSFSATATDAGCLGIASKTVFVRSKPIAAFTNDFVCQSVSTTLNDSSYSNDGASINRWRWDFGNGQFSNLQNPAVLYNTVDTIPVKLMVQSGACMSDTVTKQIIIAAKPVVDFSFTGTGCENQLIQFADSSKVSSGSVAQWSWIYQGGEWSTAQNAERSFAAGNQTISLVVVSDKGCQSDAVAKSIVITGKPLFEVNFEDACVNTLVNFTATDLSGIIQNWEWNFGNNIVSTAKDTQIVYAAPGTFPVIVLVQAVNGCTNADTSSITIYGTQAYIDKDTVIAAANQPIQLNATGGDNYEWLPADGLNNTAIANPVAINTEDKQYIVRAYTPVGCSSFDTVLIQIYNGPQIYVPSAFNPQSTVGNHLFRAIPVGITTFKYFNVYNRLGQVVFSTSNPLQGWDGNFKGVAQPAAAYVWVAAGTTFRGTDIVRTGTVVLVR